MVPNKHASGTLVPSQLVSGPIVNKLFSPSENELYPAWQGMQYMRDLMEGRIIFQKYDNDRYAYIKWTSVKEFLVNEKVGLK
jgi:hypothetical protein